MITLGQLLETIYPTVDAFDDDKKDAIKRMVNTVYFQFAAKKSWESLRKTKTIDFSSADDDGVWLPGDLAGIDYIGNSDRRFHRVDYPSYGDERYRYYMSEICDSPLFMQRMSIKQASKTFEPAVSSDYVGEYIRFGGELGVYEIDSTTTITRWFMGEPVSMEMSQIRPEGTRRLQCIDADGSQISTSVTLYYWAFPNPLYEESQAIMLPDSRALELAVMARAVGELDHRTEDAKDLRYMFPKAYEEMVSMNSPFIPPQAPDGIYGEPQGWGCD